MANSPSPTATPARIKLPRAVVPLGLFVGALWLVFWRYLSSEWSLNEQYSYGWFVPFFAAFLFWLRWEDRPEVGTRKSERGTTAVIVTGAAALFLLLPLRLFELGNPDWRPLGWLHGFVVVGLTLALVWSAGGTAWLRHFAFPICFTLVAVPWVSPVEAPVIQGLMRSVAAVAAETLNVFGVPAQLEGNLIRVNTGLVGVNEACSGVRSLQTSIMIGLLFGELKRLALPPRVLLIAGALAIALLANCARALLLVWLAATQQANAVERWHDLAGYSIVVVVFLGTMALAATLGRKSEVGDRKSEIRHRISDIRLPTSAFLLGFAWLVAVEIAVEAWYRAHERNLVPEAAWTVKWPENAPAFREIEIEESVARTLRFDEGREASWRLRNDRNAGSCFVFFFRWNAGGSSVVRARAHRPDICLPSAGWEMIEDAGVIDYEVANVRVPFRRVAFRKSGGGASAHTFFALQEDVRRPAEERPDLQLAAGVQPDWSLAGRVRTVRNGVRNLGQQVLEVVLVGDERWSAADAEREFATVVQSLIVPAAR